MITVYQKGKSFRVVSGTHAPTSPVTMEGATVRTYTDAREAYKTETDASIRNAIARIAPEVHSTDCEIFELTAREIAESSMYEDEQYEFMRRREFKLAGMNSRNRDKMLDTMVKELGITGGWFYCLSDSEPIGPYETRKAAIEAARIVNTLSEDR